MVVTEISMHLTDDNLSECILSGEFVLNHHLVVKHIQLCRNKHGKFYVRFPENNKRERVVYPITRSQYQEILAALVSYYHTIKQNRKQRNEDESIWN